ncbi:hypothetical protein Gotri_012286 [Gossypium trilobum]|uniref:Uncharacterized protein n=1 Tax=Gossypium trilobum TaxID=34281 RepID=A0A7J9DQ68_9ROSI|nr:hypothetical protein [Gossypium trilobum]
MKNVMHIYEKPSLMSFNMVSQLFSDTKKGTAISQLIYPPAFVLKKEIMPLSKTVRFNVLKVNPAGSSGGGKKAFTAM